jgi:FtsH-binding integral membrane protein
MFFQNVSFLTVVIAAIVSIGLGFLWYSPILFGRKWMKEMGYTPETIEEHKKKTGGQKGMAKTYAVMALFTLVTAYIVAALLNSLLVTGFAGLILVAVSVWLAFSMPVALNNVLFGKETKSLFAINMGFQLASLVLMALIIGIFG